MTRHVVLITYGEPPSPAFPAQLRYSWRILLGLTRTVAPIPAWALPVIALARARLRWSLWSREAYASPLEPITGAQARGLATTLAARAPGTAWRVHIAYEFRDPLLATVLHHLPPDEPVDIVPMYVVDSAFTHGISRATLAAWSRRAVWRRAPARVLPPLDPETYAEIAAKHVRHQIRSRGLGGPERALVLVAHGTLLEPPRPMETGREATELVAAAIARQLQGHFGRIVTGWLNHTYGGQWTEPPVEQALRELSEAGCREVVYFPFGFLADNAESQLEGRIALRSRPELEATHLPCLNQARALVEALGELIVSASMKPQDLVGAAR